MNWAGWVLWSYIAVVSVPLVVIDVREHRLPNKIVVPGLCLALMSGAVVLVASAGRAWWPLVFGAMYFIAMLILSVRGGLGMGDVKLAGVLGVAAGFLGLEGSVASVALAFVLGGAVAGARWLAKRRENLAFGPFMLAGFWVAAATSLISS